MNITFEIWSLAVKKSTKYNITAQNGLASFPYDTYPDFTSSTDADYGNWTIKSYVTGNPTVADSTNMSIKAGGSGFSGSGCSMGYCHQTGTSSGASPRSPYTAGYGSTTSRAVAAHEYSSHNGKGCFICHPGYAANTTGLGKTGDVHKNRTCDYCHGDWAYIRGSTGNGIPKMPGCSDCHLIFNNNLTDLNTVANLSGGNGVSVYSYNFDKKAPLTAHNGTNYSLIKSVPCIVCHGPAHNNTKPDPILANTNNITEYTQCLKCHTAYQEHNGNVSCTVCHSQDAHDIKIFAQNATYINDSKSPARGNCTNCHQNATFLNILRNQSNAGAYSGSAPQIPNPLNHSTDQNGTKWGTYWPSTKDACVYCHGDNKHIATRLGNAATPVGNDILGGEIGTGTVCSSCHNPSDSDYAATMALLIPNPVANQPPGTNWNVTGTDHASYGSSDADCKTCHGGVLSASPDISEFVHNVDAGKGGTDCIGCHTTQKGIYPGINLASFAKHRNVNTTDGSDTLTNNDCKTCHTDISNMYSPGFNVVTKTCTDCHNSSGTFAAPTISNHRPNGINISTPASWSICHNNSINVYAYSADASSGHYGTRTNLIATKDCTNCHKSP